MPNTIAARKTKDIIVASTFSLVLISIEALPPNNCTVPITLALMSAGSAKALTDEAHDPGGRRGTFKVNATKVLCQAKKLLHCDAILAAATTF